MYPTIIQRNTNIALHKTSIIPLSFHNYIRIPRISNIMYSVITANTFPPTYNCSVPGLTIPGHISSTLWALFHSSAPSTSWSERKSSSGSIMRIYISSAILWSAIRLWQACRTSLRISTSLNLYVSFIVCSFPLLIFIWLAE